MKKLSPRLWLSFILIGLMGQFAWTIENMYFNVFLYNTITTDPGAIAAMVAGGDVLIKDIVVVADSKVLIKPCGACLQRIFEFADNNTKVHLADLEGIKKTYLISELLPLAFNEEELKQ